MTDNKNTPPQTNVTGWALIDARGRVSNFTDNATDAQVWKELGYIVKEYVEAPGAQTNISTAIEACRLHVAYEAMPADRGGKLGPKGKAWTAFIAARNEALSAKPPQTRMAGAVDVQRHMAEPRAERCVACDEVLHDGDSVYCEISEGGHIHAWCATDDPKSYVDEDEQPIKEGDALPEPFPYKSEHHS